MFKINSESNNVIDYESEILEYIKNNSRGVSNTEIAKEKKFSRNTVAKYTSILEQKKLIFKKKIGTSKLFFSIEYTNYPSSLILSYCKSLLKGFKTIIPNDKKRMKDIGKMGAKYINLTMPSGFLESLNTTNEELFLEFYVELFKNLYTSFDFLQPNIEITVLEHDAKSGIAVFRFTNSTFLVKVEDFIYHLYYVCGLAEERISNAVNNPVTVDIEKIHIDDVKEFSYYDLSIRTT